MDKLHNLMQSGTAGGPPGMPSLKSMLGPEFVGQDLAKQADKLWRFLDNLAEDDPEAYADFLQSQVRAAEEEQSRQVVRGSSAQVLVEARMAGPTQGTGVLHVWAARDGGLVPMATVGHGAAEIDAYTASWAGASVPMFEGGAPEPPSAPASIQPGASTAAATPYHIGVHPKLMPMLALNQPPQLRPVLVEAAFQFIESRYPLRFDRLMPYVFKVHTGQVSSAATRAAVAASQAGGAPSAGTPHDLLQAMAGLQHSGHVNHESSGTGILGAHQPGAPVCQQGNKELAKQLIEEIHVQQSQEEGNQGEARQGNKVLGVQQGMDKEGHDCFIIEAALPEAHGVQDVGVEFMDRLGGLQGSQRMSTLVLRLEGAGWSQTVELPCMVDDSRCAAKFDKRKQVLKVTVPKAGSGA